MVEADEARVQAGQEELRFQCELLQREMRRLAAVNQTLEAKLALAEGERDGLRRYLAAIERSMPWRVAQLLRRGLGRQW